MRALTILTLLLLIFSCASDEDIIKEKKFPSDHLYEQRSFPHGAVDIKAYQKALNFRDASLGSYKGPFDKAWESLGPTNYCGRATDVEMPPDDPSKIYMGTASGGIFLSDDLGVTWEPIFDQAQSLSIGDIAIHQKIPSIMYVGTGESNAGGGSLAYDGNGVYASNDSGRTWTHKGLKNVGSIGRVCTDPNNSRTIFVGAMGSLFANNSERGVYRSTDRGDNWEQVLYVSDSTGCIDIVTHPTDSRIVYAAMWERIRRPYKRQYGGETSGIYKSKDGGDTWEELTIGLPSLPQEKGRIGIAISQSHPDVLYALYAKANGYIQGVYRSDDGGETWMEKSFRGINDVPYMWWFGRIIVDPNDADDVYVTSLNMFRSTDGAETWSMIFDDAHVDHHALFIHPEESNIVVNANDGGLNISNFLRESNSTYLTGYSNFQFYKCKIDPNDPTVIYGGAQDNGINRTRGGQEDWEYLRGGDGFSVLVEPGNPDQLYAISQNGGIFGSSNGGTSFYYGATGLFGQFNWNTPIALDPNDPATVYTGAQGLFRSQDRATNWRLYSNDLVNSNNASGNLTFGSLTTIDVSSHNSDMIYVGTDDGKVWRIENGGNSKYDISDGIPQRWITSITHDPMDPEGVYLTVSGFRFGESEGQVFYSRDRGNSWRNIGASLPDIPVNDIVIDNMMGAKFLYIATDIGVFFSGDEGINWFHLGTDIPRVPVVDLDIDIDSRTLAAATYGRGMYRFDLPAVVDVDDAELISVNVYPNPTSDLLYIDTDEDEVRLELIGMNGQVILQSSTKELSLKDLSVGSYFLRVQMPGKAPVVQNVSKI